MEFTVGQIAQLLRGEVRGNANKKITMLAKIQEANDQQITFLSNPKYEQYIYTTQAAAVITGKDFVAKKELNTTLIVVDDPYRAFTQLVEEYHRLINLQKTGVEEPSFIGKNCTVGEGVYRGAFSYIGDNVTIGKNVKIYPHVFIGDRAEIGDNTVLHPNVKLYAGTKIGKQCVLHAGVIIGSDGFGFAPQEDGSYRAIPQLGHVVIEDCVDIGANTVIDCATLPGDATKVRKGVKLDNLVHLAHNVEVGTNTVIAAQTGISGSTVIGEQCMIGGQVGIAGHLHIANRSSLGAKSGVSRSIKEENKKHFGIPAFELPSFMRSYAHFKHLPEMSNRLRELEAMVQQMKGES